MSRIEATRSREEARPTNDTVAILDAVASAADSLTIGEAGRRLPQAISELVDKGVDPTEIGAIVSGTIDAMTHRLIDLAIAEIGEPPVPWAWLALGSAARREQGIGTDQDHAIAYDPEGRSLDELNAYFLKLAEFVTSGLEGAGIPRCHADVVAVNQALRRPVEHWVEAFEAWMADPRIEAVRQTTILFDYRRVAGTLDIEETLHRTISTSSQRRAFVDRLRKMAIDSRPRRRIRLPRRIDLKHDGVMQIVALARILAVEGGIRETNTVGRLQGAVGMGLLDQTSADELASAFRLTWQARIEHQIKAAGGQEDPDDLVSIETRELRSQLADALAAIRTAQDALLRNAGERAMILRETRVPSLEPAA
jgi:CBS domain-containing protein